jgi:MSHA biogenesis protein MshN
MVERATMSIINKMHQELQNTGDISPILAPRPQQKNTQKVFLFCLIFLLLVSSIGLSYLIYTKKYNIDNIAEITATKEMALKVASPEVFVTSKYQPTIEVQPVAEVTTKVTSLQHPVVSVTPIPAEETINIVTSVSAKVEVKEISPLPIVEVIVPPVVKAASPLVVKVMATLKPKPLSVKMKPVNVEAKTKINTTEKVKTSYLEIKASTLTKQQLANIHLNNANKALAKGDSLLASQEKNKALKIKPDLHQVRKSLALYYYGRGDQERATNVLKKGALRFPEYSDFNLMLSRIALKNSDQQKAYLYLNQHPPKVTGNLDYHVSYAILAQKFKNYSQSESLYQGLLTQRANNGRWIMSLAIAQDKQGKQGLAIENYQKALLQIDLSSNAKKYVNQRLTYLANQ